MKPAHVDTAQDYAVDLGSVPPRRGAKAAHLRLNFLDALAEATTVASRAQAKRIAELEGEANVLLEQVGELTARVAGLTHHLADIVRVVLAMLPEKSAEPEPTGHLVGGALCPVDNCEEAHEPTLTKRQVAARKGAATRKANAEAKAIADRGARKSTGGKR